MTSVLVCSGLGSFLGCRSFSAKAGMAVHHSRGIESSPSEDTQLHGLWALNSSEFLPQHLQWRTAEGVVPTELSSDCSFKDPPTAELH